MPYQPTITVAVFVIAGLFFAGCLIASAIKDLNYSRQDRQRKKQNKQAQRSEVAQVSGVVGEKCQRRLAQSDTSQDMLDAAARRLPLNHELTFGAEMMAVYHDHHRSKLDGLTMTRRMSDAQG